jgi:type IV pilus assembly protein PilP
MKRNQSRPVAAGLLLLAALAGCSKKEPGSPPPPRPAQAQKPAPKPAAGVQPQLSSAQAAPAHLDFKTRTDPFKPFAAALPPPKEGTGQPQGGVAQGSAPASGDLLPIQSFEVTKFKVAGIIAGLTQNRALLIDPNGKGYVVQEGMVIGSNNGRITRITSTGVEVMETFKADNGRIRKRKVVLTLAKKR